MDTATIRAMERVVARMLEPRGLVEVGVVNTRVVEVDRATEVVFEVEEDLEVTIKHLRVKA